MARTTLVTGGNRGIGQQVARVLAGDGWDVLMRSQPHERQVWPPAATHPPNQANVQ